MQSSIEDFKIILNNHGSIVDFKIYEIFARTENSISFRTENGGMTDNINEAEIICQGHVKWDGCSNVLFYPESNGYIHFCSLHDAKIIPILIENIYKQAAVLLNISENDDLFWN